MGQAPLYEFLNSEGFKYSLLSAFYIIPEDAPIATRMVILSLMTWGLIDQLLSIYKRSITKIHSGDVIAKLYLKTDMIRLIQKTLTNSQIQA